MNKQDKIIMEKLQSDKNISDKANNIFENFKGGIELENKKAEKKVIKISLKQFISIAASFVIVLFLGVNLYAHSLGKPNIYTAIKNLFNVNKDNYEASEGEINITKESNGVKLTLKTAAMDENVLILKYEAEGEKLAKEFFTYQDLEEQEIESVNIQLYNTGWKTEGDYEGKTSQDALLIRRSVKDNLINEGLTEKEAQDLEGRAANAYQLYVQATLSPKEYSLEKAEKAIEQVVAEYESKIGNKENILQSNDTLSNFGIEAVSQTIEKLDNKYIMYSIYAVDTMSDLADTFKLNVNINKISTIEGNWDYEVELNKARLNTRVETISFSNEVDILGVKVAVKKLSISDFSSVLIIQNDYSGVAANATRDNFTYIVTDENGNILGKNGLIKDKAIYANRIILKNVNSNTKKLFVKIFLNGYSADWQVLKTLELDINEARNAKNIELTRIYANNDDLNVRFYYPTNWIEQDRYAVDTPIKVCSPANVDGDCVTFMIEKVKKENELARKDTFEGLPSMTDMQVSNQHALLVKGETKEGANLTLVQINTDKYTYYISYTSESKVEYERYYSVFEAMLKTVEILKEQEVEKTNALSNAELDFFTHYFNETSNNGFLLSNYSKPSEIDLHEVFYNGAGIKQADLSKDEIEDVFKGEIQTDITNLLTIQVTNLFKEKTGEELENISQRLCKWNYSKKYDTYYWEHGDTNYISCECTAGKITEDGLYVIEINRKEREDTCTVTLRKLGEKYLFVSNFTNYTKGANQISANENFAISFIHKEGDEYIIGAYLLDNCSPTFSKEQYENVLSGDEFGFRNSRWKYSPNSNGNNDFKYVQSGNYKLALIYNDDSNYAYLENMAGVCTEGLRDYNFFEAIAFKVDKDVKIYDFWCEFTSEDDKVKIDGKTYTMASGKRCNNN